MEQDTAQTPTSPQTPVPPQVAQPPIVQAQKPEAHAQQQAVTQPPPQDSSGLKKSLLIAAILGFLVAAGFVGFLFLTNQKKQAQSPTRTTVIVSPSPAASPSPVQELEAESYVSYQTIDLVDSQGEVAGTATRSIIPGSVFVKVQVTLPDPEEGSFYQGWLANDLGDFTQLWKLSKYTDSQFILVSHAAAPSFKSFENVLFNNLVVTLESVDDEVVETRILEGFFTQ